MAWNYRCLLTLLIDAITPTPKTENRPPVDLEGMNVPTAREGREIPVLFGTKNIEAPNVVWYGDLKSGAVKG